MSTEKLIAVSVKIPESAKLLWRVGAATKTQKMGEWLADAIRKAAKEAGA